MAIKECFNFIQFRILQKLFKNYSSAFWTVYGGMLPLQILFNLN